MAQAEIPFKFQPTDSITIANVKMAVFGTQDGDGKYITAGDLNWLIQIGAYKPPVSYHIGGHGESWTAEPAKNGNGEPRFSAPNPYDKMWQIVEAIPA